jgi:hypothetical protein
MKVFIRQNNLAKPFLSKSLNNLYIIVRIYEGFSNVIGRLSEGYRKVSAMLSGGIINVLRYKTEVQYKECNMLGGKS